MPSGCSPAPIHPGADTCHRPSFHDTYSIDRDEILRVLRAFEAAGLEYVLIGAIARGFHGVVRATRA